MSICLAGKYTTLAESWATAGKVMITISSQSFVFLICSLIGNRRRIAFTPASFQPPHTLRPTRHPALLGLCRLLRRDPDARRLCRRLFVRLGQSLCQPE